jgi:hypothetical protein
VDVANLRVINIGTIVTGDVEAPLVEGRQSLWCNEKLLTCVAYASKEEYSSRATVAFSCISTT